MKVLAIVVTYNRCELLIQCLDHLEAQTTPCDILVIDNASIDGTEQYMSSRKGKHIHYLRMKENTGGAGGFSAGMEWGAGRDYDYLWILDDDTLPEPEALEKLTEAGAKCGSRFGWLSSRAFWTDGNLCAMNVQRISPYRDLKSFDAEIIPCKMASFVSLLVPRDMVLRYGLPISDFFIWSDDWEYTRRISLSESCYAVPESKVIHAMKNNTVVNIANDNPERLGRYRYFYRNDVYLYRREGILGWLWIIMKDCWHSIQVIKGSQKEKGRALRIIWGGFIEGIHFHPETQGK